MKISKKGGVSPLLRMSGIVKGASIALMTLFMYVQNRFTAGAGAGAGTGAGQGCPGHLGSRWGLKAKGNYTSALQIGW